MGSAFNSFYCAPRLKTVFPRIAYNSTCLLLSHAILDDIFFISKAGVNPLSVKPRGWRTANWKSGRVMFITAYIFHEGFATLRNSYMPWSLMCLSTRYKSLEREFTKFSWCELFFFAHTIFDMYVELKIYSFQYLLHLMGTSKRRILIELCVYLLSFSQML